VEGTNLPSTIERTCTFDAKIYKNVSCIIVVSACGEKNKKIFQISDFCFQLQAVLVENSAQISYIRSFLDGINVKGIFVAKYEKI